MTLQEILFKALMSLDPNNPDQWTSNGEPKLEIVNVLVDSDHKFTRAEIDQLAPGFKSNNMYDLSVLKEQMPEALMVNSNDESVGDDIPSDSADDDEEEPKEPEEPTDTAQTVADQFLANITSLCNEYKAKCDAMLTAQPPESNVKNATLLRDGAYLGSLKVKELTVNLDALLVSFSSNFTTNATKNTQDSINGYLEAQKTRPRVVEELGVKYIHPIDDPRLQK